MASERKVLLEHEQYVIYKNRLGEGGFGQVYLGFDIERDRDIAAKRILVGSNDFSLKEVNVLLKLKEHDNIVRIYDTFIVDEVRWIVMQYCRGRTLANYMEEDDPKFPVRLELIEQLVEGVLYMHSSSPRIAHRDLKPPNIMIVRGHQLKICDFGLAKIVDTTRVSTFGGTLAYMAPEFFASATYDPFKTDAFSGGLLLIGIATFSAGTRLDNIFRTEFGVAIGQQMLQKDCQNILKEKLSALHYPCEQTMMIISLATDMVAFNPDERPTFKEISRRLKAITGHRSEDSDALPPQHAVGDLTESAKGLAVSGGTTPTQANLKDDEKVEGPIDGSSVTLKQPSAGEKREAGSQDGAKPKQWPVTGGIGKAGGDGNRTKQMTKQFEAPRPKDARDGTKQKHPQAEYEAKARSEDDTRPKQTIRKVDAARPKESPHGANPSQPPRVQTQVRTKREGGTRPKGKVKESPDGAKPNQSGAQAQVRAKSEGGTRPKEKGKGSPSGGAVSLEIVDTYDLPFKGFYYPAFSSNGSILLQDSSDQHFHLYELRGGKYYQVSAKKFPCCVDDYFRAVLSTGEILLQQTTDTDTIQYSRDLQQQKTFQRKGRLLGCTDDEHVVYGRGTEGKKDWTIDVWNEQERVMILRHPATEGRVSRLLRRDGWGECLSVCSVGDKIVVVEWESESFVIFTKQGKHVRHCHLGYEPLGWYAVIAWGDEHVIIADNNTDVLHVHSLDGREVGRHELGLRSGDAVWGVCCSRDGILHVATGPYNREEDAYKWFVTSLRAYKLV